MSYEQIVEKYRIDDICPEIDNELNGMFVDMLGDEFELGIFSEQSPKNDSSFVVSSVPTFFIGERAAEAQIQKTCQGPAL